MTKQQSNFAKPTHAAIDTLNDVVLHVGSYADCEEVVRATCYEARENGQAYEDEDTPVVTAIEDLSDKYRQMVHDSTYDNTVPDQVFSFRYETDSESGELVAEDFKAAKSMLDKMLTADAIADGAWGWVEDRNGERYEIGAAE